MKSNTLGVQLKKTEAELHQQEKQMNDQMRVSHYGTQGTGSNLGVAGVREDGCVYNVYILMRIRIYRCLKKFMYVCTYVRICKHVCTCV